MQLRYRLIVAAVGAACATAHAQSTVEIYGTIIPFFENVKTTGATSAAPPAAERPSQLSAAAYTGLNDARRNRLSAGTSALGFRGTEKLGGDLTLVWQLESAFQIDQNTGPGLGARDSKIGLQNRFGEFFFGQWDTPYKYITLAVNPLRAGYVFDRTAIPGNPGMGVPSTTTQFTRIGAKPDASFDRRAGNSVQYWSPKLAGFTFRVAHSVNEGKGTVTATGPLVSPTINAASVQYDVGKLSLRYGYEEHKDYFGMSQIGGSAAGTATNSSSKDHGHKLVVLYRIGSTRLTGLIEQLEYRNNDSLAGAVRGYKRNAFYGVVEQFFSNSSSVWFSYGRASDGSCTRVGGAACSTHAIGANYMTTGYIYRFTKRTEVFAAYYRLSNKENGTYSPGPIVGASIAPGADTIGVGVGMVHYF